MSPDPSAEALLEHADWVAALAARLVADPAQADDLVQTTWLEALKSRPGEIRNPRAWLGAVVRNAARQWRRAEDRRRRREEAAAERESWPSAADLVARANLQREVVGRVVDLDEPYRTTVLLRYFEGLPQREIAVRMECPVATVNTRLQRALGKLRERLDEDYADRSTWSAALLPLLSLAGPRALHLASSPGAATGALPVGVPGGLLVALGAAGLVATAVAVGLFVAEPFAGSAPAPAELVAPPVAVGERLEPAAELVMPVGGLAPAPSALAERRSLGAPADARVTAWPQLHGGPAHANHRRRRDPILFPRVLWHVPAVRGQPAVAGGDVYAVGAGLQRIDAASGRVLAWQPADERGAAPGPGGDAPLAFVGAPAIAPTSSGAVIARRSDGAVVAWDRSLTRRLWVRLLDPPTAGAAAPGVLAAGVYVCASGGSLLGLAQADGATRWSFRLEPGDAVDVTPAVADGRVCFGTRGGRALALDVESGAVAWRRELVPGLGGADPVVAEGLVLLADRGVRGERRGALHALALEDGELRWSHVYGSMDLSTPGLGAGELFAHAAREVTAVDLESGRAGRVEQRTGRACGAAPLLVGETLLSADREGFLYARSRERGELAWAFWLPGGSIDRFACVDGRLLVTTSAGLYALGDDPAAGRLPRGFVLRADAR